MNEDDLELKLNLRSPVLPFLVVIKTTPFAALDPYIAVAEASFKILIASISAGFIAFNGLLDPPTPPESKGIPSTTYKGLEFKFKEPIPLIRTLESSVESGLNIFAANSFIIQKDPEFQFGDNRKKYRNRVNITLDQYKKLKLRSKLPLLVSPATGKGSRNASYKTNKVKLYQNLNFVAKYNYFHFQAY